MSRDFVMKLEILDRGYFYWVIAYLCLIAFSHHYIVTERFGYMGFLESVSYPRIVVWSAVSIFLSGFIYRERRSLPSDLVVALLLFLIVIPIGGLWALEGLQGFIYLYAVLFIMALVTWVHVLPFMQMPAFSIAIRQLVMFSISVLGVATVAFVAMKVGFSNINYDLARVYEKRSSLPSFDGGIGYLISWVGYVILPAMIAYGAMTRKWVYLLAGIFLAIYFFGLLNFKTFLFAPIVVMGFSYVREVNKFSLVVFSLFVVLMASSIVALALPASTLANVLVQRVFYIPAYLHFLYYEFFSKTSPMLFSGNFLSGIVRNPIGADPVTAIALEYWGREFSPNVGVIADSYMNLHWYGVLVVPLLLAILLRLFDSLSGISRNISFGLIAVLSMPLLNSAFSTVLLTHGFLLALMLCLAINRKD